ncbi:MAG: STAS domain-containing protein [Acidobacteria bacterium]|jgi:anti-anti-sigma factor|nr:STAS domain-containing protein [Acidobacteriota bacterium]
MLLTSKIEPIEDRQVVIKVTGSMTLGASLKVLDAQVQNLVSNGVNTVVFDLTGVDFIDSAGLGLLMLARRLLEKRDAMLRLCGAQARVRALLRMTKTDALLHLDESLEDSLEAIRRN